MATNPMQKKARNSFILGVLITFIIMALIVAYLFLQMKKLQDEQAKMAANFFFCYICILFIRIRLYEVYGISGFFRFSCLFLRC